MRKQGRQCAVHLLTMTMVCAATCEQLSTHDPYETPRVLVVVDEAVLKANPNIPGIFRNITNYPDVGSSMPGIFANITSYADLRLQSPQFEIIVATDQSEYLQQVCDKLRDGLVGLVSMTPPSMTSQLRGLAESSGLVFVSVADDSYFRDAGRHPQLHVRVEPTAAQMLKVVAAIVMHENLTDVALVFDDTFDVQNTPRRILANVPAQHLYLRLSQSENETQRQVNVLKEIDIQNVFLIASVHNAKRFVQEIDRVIPDRKSPNIFLLTKESELKCSDCRTRGQVVVVTASSSAVALQNFVTFMQSHVVSNGVYDSSEVKVDEALAFDLAVLIQSAMTADVCNIAYENCSTINFTLEVLEQSRQLAEALKQERKDGVFGTLSTQDGHVRYSMSLSISRYIFQDGVKHDQLWLGSWTRAEGLNASQPLVQRDKKPHYMVVTVPGNPPFVYKGPAPNGTDSPLYYGYCIDLLKSIAEQLNFDYTIYDSPDGLFGTMDENGQWNGVVRELIDKRADIAVAPMSVMAERESVVDFTVPYYDLVGLTILMRKPKLDYSLVKFLSVLDEAVWGCIIAAFLVFSVLIWLFDKFSPYSYQNSHSQTEVQDGRHHQGARIFTFKEGIWFCLMSLTPQGGGETPRAFSGRLVAATWWLFGFIIIATYTANLAAFLTVSRLETSIESLDDLSTQFKVKYAPMNGSTAHTYFSRMAHIEDTFFNVWKDMSLSNNMAAKERAKLAVWDYPISDKYTKLWNNMKTTPFPRSKDEAVDLILSGDFAFISDGTTNKYATYTNCDLVMVGEEFSRKPYAFAVQEGSPLRNDLSNVILQLINQRRLEEMKSYWWQRDKLDCPEVEDESDGISIRNIGGVFLVIAIGSVLALLVLAAECYW